ncbi:MAG TPA: prenyltransferase/squalene oxidase repeat-containing protein [Desulfurivibrionaceae bacterium]|nr:prenyltransferase/squalene oxidase repeat-containing protein [Desulfurivibrionaceae bacterium]
MNWREEGMFGKVDFAGVVSFVAKRRKATGGYGATPRLPATIEDTFEAVAISRDLAVLAPSTCLPHPPETDTELHDYLRETERRTWPGLRTTGQLLQTCRFLGIPIDPKRVRGYTADHCSGRNDLPTIYYATLLEREIPPINPLGQTRNVPALPGRPTAEDVRMHLALRKLGGVAETSDQGGLLAWLRRCQNGDGGFGFFPGTTSFIENSHHCLAALTILGGGPAEPEKARQFVLSCQTGRGGFGRSLRAAPFLDSTWHALDCLTLLP